MIETWQNFKSLDVDSYLIVDHQVYKHFSNLFSHLNSSCILIIDAPEQNKSFSGVEKVINFFASRNIGRNDEVYAIGGGALLDLVGFCASIYKRGIGVNFIPSTLLAMVDAAIGGKNGINQHGLKNLVGTFYSPLKIIYYFPFLASLSKKERLSGFAEGLKLGLIASSDLWKSLNFEMMTPDDILRCAHIKNEIVAQDPFDREMRHILNFGHSFGHGYEAASNFTVPHGHAVACGMIVEANISLEKGVLSTSMHQEIVERLKSLYAPFEKIPFSKIASFIKHDKKNDKKNLFVHLLKSIGSPPDLHVVTLDIFEHAYGNLWI